MASVACSTTVNPYLDIKGGAGRVGHAELTIGGSTLYVADEPPEIGAISPSTLRQRAKAVRG